MASDAAERQAVKRELETAAARDGDRMVITPLGAGSEVGRSCVHMSYRGKTVMVRGLNGRREEEYENLGY